jgi:hypothetical protein
MMGEDRVRVLRLVEYEGPRNLVEAQILNSIHGTRMTCQGRVRITAVTLDQFPEVLEKARTIEDVRVSDDRFNPATDYPGGVL